MEEWQKRAALRDQATQDIPEWMKKAIARDSGASDIFGDAGPVAANIDDSEDAPAMVRMQVGALDKPEDRLAALRKTYPDAKPYGDDNFIYTDENGKVRQYNTESWFPGLGDLASIAPEVGETVGGAGGGLLGALLGAGTGAGTGAVAGSVVPGPGTAAGAIGGAGYGGVVGAMTGAGLGSVVGREATKDTLNYLFGNEDTRTTKEQLVDVAQTAALGAAGEGAGMLIGKGLQAGKRFIPGTDAYKASVVGLPDDPTKVAQRLQDWQKIGVEPTAGMVSGNQRTALLEHALIPTRTGHQIQERIEDAFKAQGDEFSRVVDGISSKPLSVAEAGEALKKQAQMAKDAAYARNNQLYDKIGEKITSPAVADSTASFLKSLADERAGFGEFDKLTRGAQTDQVISQAQAIVADAGKGMPFEKLKQMRTHISQLAEGTDDRVLQGQLNGLRAALTADMEKTAIANGPDALQAFKKANNNHRRMVSEDRFGKGSVADTILKKNGDDIYNWSMASQKNGGNRIAQTRRLVERSEGGKEAWDQVVSGFTERLGSTAVDGANEFNPTLFLNQWSKNVSPEAKDAIFKGTKNAAYRQDLDTLSRLAKDFQVYRKSANHSNTQNHKSVLESMDPFNRNNIMATALGVGSSLATGGAAATGVIAGAAKGAIGGTSRMMRQGSRVKLLQNPETVAWLANVGKAQMQKGGLKDHLGKLKTLAVNTPDNALASAIDDYLKDLNYSEDQ
jgi:hypothetical protein